MRMVRSLAKLPALVERRRCEAGHTRLNQRGEAPLLRKQFVSGKSRALGGKHLWQD
jgi:hypothetical protein